MQRTLHACILKTHWMAFSHPLAFVLFSCGDVVLSCPLLCPHESSFPFFSVDLPPSYFWCFMTALLNNFLKLWDEFEIHWYLHPLSLFVPLFISFFLIFSLPIIPLFSLSTNSDKDLLSQTRTLAMSFVKCASTDTEHQYKLVKDISFWY